MIKQWNKMSTDIRKIFWGKNDANTEQQWQKKVRKGVILVENQSINIEKKLKIILLNAEEKYNVRKSIAI